jgi:hypothetical protein
VHAKKKEKISQPRESPVQNSPPHASHPSVVSSGEGEAASAAGSSRAPLGGARSQDLVPHTMVAAKHELRRLWALQVAVAPLLHAVNDAVAAPTTQVSGDEQGV